MPRKRNAEQAREYTRRYRLEHPSHAHEYYERTKEQHAEYGKKYAKDHPEKARQYSVNWRAQNPEKVKAMAEAYREAHRDELRASYRAYDAAHREERRVKANARRKLNLDKYRVAESNRRGRLRNAEGKFTKQDIDSLFIKQLAKCANMSCRTSLKSVGYHIDHIMPTAKGGSNWPDNLQLLCPDCNRRKHTKDPEQWAAENGLLFC